MGPPREKCQRLMSLYGGGCLGFGKIWALLFCFFSFGGVFFVFVLILIYLGTLVGIFSDLFIFLCTLFGFFCLFLFFLCLIFFLLFDGSIKILWSSWALVFFMSLS